MWFFSLCIFGLCKVSAQTCNIDAPPTICIGGNFLYTASTDLSSATFSWNLINNTSNASIIGAPTANQASINHGTTTGSYTIEVKALQGATTITCTRTITVSSSISITAQPVSITSGIGCSVSFGVTATGNGTLTYQWKKGNAILNSETGPTLSLTGLVAADAGSYSVEVSNGCGSVTSNAATLTVNPALNAGSHNTASINSCTGVNPVELNFEVSNGYIAPSGGLLPYTYQWKLNGNNIPGATVDSYDPDVLTTAGTYSYNLEIKDACGTIVSTQPKVYTVVADPSVSITGAGTYCQGSTPALTAVVTGGIGSYTYRWESSNTASGPWTTVISGPSSTFNPPTATSGTVYYRVVLEPNVASCNNASAVVSVIINAKPAAPTATEQSFCSGTSPTVANLLPAGTGIQWFAASTGGTALPSNTPLTTGTYHVSQTTNNCESARTAVNITVNPTPAAPTASAQSFCSAANPTVSNLVATGTAIKWYAALTGGSALASTAALATGTYYASQTVSGCESARSSVAVTVNQSTAPAVNITANPGNTICAGTSVTFTAVATNSGTTPSYQWKVNGVNVGSNSATFTSTTLANTDKVSVVVTSSAICPNPATATSNVITMTVNALVTPSVTIASSATTICPGTTVNFTATAINGGNAPVYQWKVNGAPVGTNSASFSSAALNNGDAISVTVTSNANCASPATATSAPININVTPAPVPSVTIAGSANNICPGTSVSFTATPTNGGTAPVYQWKVNGTNVGTNSSTFTSSALNNNDIVTVVMTSNAPCASPTTATSNGITMVVIPAPVPSVSIAASATTVCPGTSVTVTATPTNGGANPSYQWQVNGVNAGTNSATFNSSSLNNNDVIKVIMTSNAPCAAPLTATSSPISITVSPAAPATPGAITGAANQCVGKTGLVYSITSVPNATSYTWTLPAGWSITAGSNTNSITVSTSASAVSGNITVTANNSCGVSAVQSFPVTVSTGVPTTPAQILGAISLCPPNIGLAYEIAPVAGAISYNWTVPSGWTITGGAGTPEITVNVSAAAATGTNNISVVAINACGSSSQSILAVTNGNSATANAGADQLTCAGQTFSLNGTVGGALNPNTPKNYIWSFSPSGAGSLSSINGNNPTFTPANGFTGDVTFTLTTPKPEGNCAAATDQVIFTIRPLPTVSISAITPVCSGNSSIVTFSGTPNTTVTYRIGTGSNQTILINGTGTATLTTANLTAATTYTLVSIAYSTGSSCNQTITGSVTISVTPSPTVNGGGPNVICQSASPTAIVLSGASIGGSATSAAWSITSGGGTLSNTDQTSSPQTVTYTPAANYTGSVSLTLTTAASGGCSAVSAIRTITINPAPTVTAGGPQEVCQSATPTAITLTGSSVSGGATTAAWSITSGGGTLSSTAQTGSPSTVTYTPAANFTGTVTLTLTTNAPASCIPATATRTINVNPAPTITAGPAQTICSGSTATMAATLGGGATSGTWTSSGSGTFSNNSTTAIYTPSATDINTGSVTLTYTSDDPAGPCVAVSSSTTLTIKKAVLITNQPSNTAVCAGLPADLNVTAVGDGLTYQWYKGVAPGGTAVNNTSNISGAQSATLHFNQGTLADDGSYYVVISGLAPCSAVTSEVRTLNVDQAIIITTQPVSQTLCESVNATFSVVANANGDPLTYQWRKNGVNISGETSSSITLNNITAANAGSYDVVITGPSGYTCSSTISTPATLTVSANSTLSLSSAAGTNAQTTCINSAISNITYTVGGGATGATVSGLPAGVTGTYNNGVFTVSGTPSVVGTSTYTVSTTGPCVNTSLTGTITVNANSTISLSSGNSASTICQNTPLTNITYTVGGGATGATISGLPAGVTGTYSNGTFTISGTPTTPGNYNYTVTTTGPCTNPSLTGTINVGANSTLSLSGGNANTTLCQNAALTNITYAVGGGATGATVSGLPTGVTGTYSNGVFTISGTPTVSGSFPYTVSTTGPCANISMNGSITVDKSAVGGTISPATTTVCSGSNSGTLTLSGNSGSIIRWETSTNGGSTWTPTSNTTNTQSYSNLTQTIAYRAVLQNGVCPVTYSTIGVVSVIPPLPPTSAIATPPQICIGECTNLTAAADGFPTGWLGVQAFNSANLDQNEGWSATYNGLPHNIEASADNEVNSPWNLTNPIDPFGVEYDNPDADKYAVATGSTNTTMISNVFNLIGMSTATFSFQTAYDLKAGAIIKVEISTDGGATYQSVPLMEIIGPATFGTPNKGWPYLQFNLSQYLGLSNLKIRWNYTGSPGSIWAVDNAGITPPPLPLEYDWTLVNPSGVPSPYYLNVTDSSSVTACPPAAGTYTYQVATTYGSCPGGTMNVQVVVLPLPVCNIIGSTTVCPGSSNIYSGPATTGYSYQWMVNGAASISGSSTGQSVTVIANNLCGTYSVSLVTTINNCSSDTCTLLVNIVDTEAPVISLTAPGSIVCNPTAAEIAGAFGSATVTDNCTTGLMAAYTDGAEVAGANCQFSVTRTWTVSDSCGNTQTAEQTITFNRDNEKPVITLLPATTVACNATAAEVAAAFGTATVTDNCSTGLTATGTIQEESVSGCMVTVKKTWTVTDACNNTQTAEQTITFTRDNEKPVLTCPTVAPACVVPGNSYTIPPLTASDNCTANSALNITYSITGVTTRNGTGVDASGIFNVGVSTITWTVVDECGNSNTCTTEVVISPKPIPTIYHN